MPKRPNRPKKTTSFDNSICIPKHAVSHYDDMGDTEVKVNVVIHTTVPLKDLEAVMISLDCMLEDAEGKIVTERYWMVE